MTGAIKRGALIVFEGCDRSGKTTQVTRLVERLNSAGKPAVMRRFPDRTTSIGTVINSYLGCKKELDDHVVHLLFSANRWELKKEIVETLESGTSVCIDRYAYSGVAFSAAKVCFIDRICNCGPLYELCCNNVCNNTSSL